MVVLAEEVEGGQAQHAEHLGDVRGLQGAEGRGGRVGVGGQGRQAGIERPPQFSTKAQLQSAEGQEVKGQTQVSQVHTQWPGTASGGEGWTPHTNSPHLVAVRRPREAVLGHGGELLQQLHEAGLLVSLVHDDAVPVDCLGEGG